MPPAPTPSITPSPAHTAVFGARPNKAHRYGSILLILIVAAFAGSAFYNNWNARILGTVTVLVRDTTGAGSVESLTLANGVAVPTSTKHEDVLASLADRSFVGPDGATITLAPVGVVEVSKDGATKTLIASVVPPPASTPLAVWNNGALIAWVNPTDRSLQVFSRSARGVYLPVYATSEVRVNSIGFATDHPTLVVTNIVSAQGGAVTTAVSAIDFALSVRSLHPVLTQNSFLTIVNP